MSFFGLENLAISEIWLRDASKIRDKQESQTDLLGLWYLEGPQNLHKSPRILTGALRNLQTVSNLETQAEDTVNDGNKWWFSEPILKVISCLNMAVGTWTITSVFWQKKTGSREKVHHLFKETSWNYPRILLITYHCMGLVTKRPAPAMMRPTNMVL